MTVIECITADGWVMAPFIIFKGQSQDHMENGYQQDTLPDDYRIATSSNGWSNDALDYDWLHMFHVKAKNRIRRKGWRLLLMDGHGSHLTFQFLSYCQQHQIIPFSFPPHTTHLLQPLDHKPFQVYKHYYRQTNNMVVQWGGSVKDKRDFLHEIHDVRMKTFTQRTLRQALRDCGIHPFNPDLILDLLKEAKSPTPELRMITGDTPPPLSSSSEPISSPPDTIIKLRRTIDKAEKRMN